MHIPMFDTTIFADSKASLEQHHRMLLLDLNVVVSLHARYRHRQHFYYGSNFMIVSSDAACRL